MIGQSYFQTPWPSKAPVIWWVAGWVGKCIQGFRGCPGLSFLQALVAVNRTSGLARRVGWAWALFGLPCAGIPSHSGIYFLQPRQKSQIESVAFPTDSLLRLLLPQIILLHQWVSFLGPWLKEASPQDYLAPPRESSCWLMWWGFRRRRGWWEHQGKRRQQILCVYPKFSILFKNKCFCDYTSWTISRAPKCLFCQFYPTLYKVALCGDILTASLDYSIVTVILVLHEKRQAQSHLGLSRYSSLCLDDPIGIWPAPSSKSVSFK